MRIGPALCRFLLLAFAVLPLSASAPPEQPPLSSPTTKADLLQSLASLKSGVQAAVVSGDVAHLVKLVSVYSELKQYNHASFILSATHKLLKSQPSLDPENVHMKMLAEMGDMLNSERLLAGTIYLNFKHPTDPASKTDQSPVPLAVPYYLCLDTMNPMFLQEADSCKYILPMAIVAMVDNTSDYDFLNNVVSAICSDNLGFGESTKAAFESCQTCVTQAMANEIYSINTENDASGSNAWKRGDFPLDWGFKKTMDDLDRVSVNAPGLQLEGNLWHQNGWSKVDGKEVGFDGVPTVRNDELPTSVGDKQNNSSGTNGFSDALVRANKRRALLTLISVSLENGVGKYLEVGFNAGHSAGMVLEMFPGVNVTSFDLCSHEYTPRAFEQLKKMFSDRVELICGNR